MLRAKQTKSSQYIVCIGWAIERYADNISEVKELIRLWGEEKVSYEYITKEGK
jgi:hypothetical protein